MRMSDWSSDVCSSELVQGLAEALRFAQAAELDLDKLFDAISGGAAQSWQMDKHWKTLAADSFDFGFAVDWMRKALWLALADAQANAQHLPVPAQTDPFYHAFTAMAGPRTDTRAHHRR